MDEVDEYIIGARDPANKKADLQRVLDVIDKRDDATLASGDTTEHLVVRMAEAAVRDIKAQMGNDFIIEKNAPLRY